MRPKGSARPPKWPFLLADGALLAVAAVIALMDDVPISETAIIIFSCVFLGSAVGITPFLLDFSAARHEDLIEAREQLEELAQKLAESADYIGTVSGQFQAINDATIKAVHLAESLPYKMQEKVGEIAQSIQQGQDEEKEAMAAELEELRENESRHLETAIDKARASLDAAVKRVEAAEKALAAAAAALEAHVKSAPAAATKAPVSEPPPPAPKKKETPSPAPEPAAKAEEPPPAAPDAKEESAKAPAHPKAKEHSRVVKHEKSAAPAPAKEPAKSEKAPPPEKEEPAPAPTPPPRKKAAAKPAEHEILPGLDPVVVRDDESDDEDGGAAKTSDGSTRLLVTAYIGIGNKVFARGDGPGLNPDKGQPLEFVSIGKWLWQTSEATAPVTIQLYKNDEVKALGDDITIDPGYHVETTPVFKDPNPF